MAATAQDLAALEELANSERFPYLARMIDVVTSWISSPNLAGNVPPEVSASAGADLVDFLPRLPKAMSAASEIDFVLGYKPSDMALLPKEDATQVIAWHGFHSQGVLHCGDTMTADPDELRKQWVKLVEDLAIFVAHRRRIRRQLNGVRGSRPK